MPVRKWLAAIALCTFGGAHAAIIEYVPVELGDGFWRYDYTVQQEADRTYDIAEFTLFFDRALYSSLSVIANPFGWDAVVAQPDPRLPDDGFVDWLALGRGVAPGGSLGGFSVSFSWFGRGTPGTQRFDVIDPESFTVLFSGLTRPVRPPTPLSEPGTLALLGMALLGIALARRRRGVGLPPLRAGPKRFNKRFILSSRRHRGPIPVI